MKILRKFTLTLLFSALAVAFVACGTSTPGEVATNCLKAGYKGDSDTLWNCLAFSDEDKAKAKPGEIEMAQGKIKSAVAQQAKKAQELGGVKSVELVSEEIKENSARVVVKVSFGNGETREDKAQLVKLKDEWKILPR